MATSSRQKLYNQKYRDKQAKIKAFAKQLDQLVAALGALPPCPACARVIPRLAPFRPGCVHTSARHKLDREAALVRAQLEQVEH